MSSEKTIIGRTARIEILSESMKDVPAKIDTGADSSAVWASELEMSDDGVLSFCLFAKGSQFYTGERHRVTEYTAAAVRSAHGAVQIRYKVRLAIRLRGRQVRSTFTLADRSKNQYPVLVGCRLLRGKFLVDVARGLDGRNTSTSDELNCELQSSPKAFFDKYHKDNHRGDTTL